jgi:phosphodiesterase/alkaline phosphatase D-like protein
VAVGRQRAEERELERSHATWKLTAADMPLGVVVPDGTNIEAVANGDPRLLGRELEFARLLSFIKRRRIRNVVFVTADVHYTAALAYDPDKAVFQDFDPSGSSSPGRSTPAPSAPTPSTRPSARSSASSGSRTPPTSRPPPACNSSGTSPSTPPTRPSPCASRT